MGWFVDEFYKWKKYSDNYPWREGKVCKGHAMNCTYTNCAMWHFLKKYDKNVLKDKEEE